MPDCSLYAASPDWMKLIVVIGFYLIVFGSIYLISHTAIVIARLKYKYHQTASDNEASEKQYSYGMDENNHPLEHRIFNRTYILPL